MQTWTAAHFGRHFVTNPRQVKQNIEAAARHAERTGVKVLCLGALNKAESINGGGIGVVQALGPSRSVSVIHGNHLTAAAVVETTYQAFGNKAKVFLTGASSKVGWAVAQALRDRHGYQILCHSTDGGRRQYFEEQGFSSASTLAEGTSYSHFWIVGKYDRAVAKLIPQNATAVVFSVPHPLESRKDVRVIEAGTLHIDMARLDRPRWFTNKLKSHEVFACHAASVVANYRLKKDGSTRIDETGPVDPNTMDSWLKDAEQLGFYIPHIDPAVFVPFMSTQRPSVVIVGAGPAGLAVAACLSRRQIPTILLEAQAAPDSFGSWAHHFSGLEVTSQKKWCNLPGFAMSDQQFPGENVTATDYQRYLQLYAARFGLEIRRDVSVQSIEKGTENEPWRVTCESEHETLVVAASAVVVATGKHRIPQRNTNDDLASRLAASEIPVCHSTDLRDEATWSQAIQSAQGGRLCMVGMGNSAADLATAILQQCPNDDEAKIHVAARTVPPIFPRQKKFLRVDTLGYLVRWMPHVLQEGIIRLLWWGIPSSRQCDSAFPSHLPRWKEIRGRVPVIDKYGAVAAALKSGRMLGHGPIVAISLSGRRLSFQDEPHARDTTPGVAIDLVILATGYQKDCLITREDRLNGLYKCGFGNDRLLPLRSIGEEAQRIATDITSDWNVSD
jgi:cation diffusion facilitator CzcD-associated flavoprotein CzcO